MGAAVRDPPLRRWYDWIDKAGGERKMKPHPKILSISGVLIYSMGILLGLSLCGWYVWGEVEASLLVFHTGDRGIHLLCPLMLNSTEQGSISAAFNNPTDEEIRPTVQAVISHKNIPRTENSVLTLAPGQAQKLIWNVNREDEVFGGLILVNVFETSQRNFLSHQGSCSIMFWKFPLLSGKWVFTVLFLISVVAIAAGILLWLKSNSPLRDMKLNATNAGITLAVVIMGALLLVLPRWWILSGLLFLFSIMLIVIMITQFVLFPEGNTRRKI